MTSLHLLLFLIALVAVLRNLSVQPKFRWAFKFFPLPFWCYMIPMAGTSLGWLPSSHPLYSALSQQLLPICLVLLLIGTDLKGIARLGPVAIILMLTGSFGTILGGLASLALYHRWLPPDSWAAVGALAGSWIGGSANMLAVKEALRTPDALMAPIILVDAIVAYSWMALLIWSSAWQEPWQRLTQRQREGAGFSDPRDDPSEVVSLKAGPRSLRLSESSPAENRARSGHLLSSNPAPSHGAVSSNVNGLATGIALAVSLSVMAQWIGRRLPTMGWVMNPSSWTILLVTTLALILSLTPLRRIEQAGLSRVGTFALYVLLASIGARANFQAIAQAPVFIAFGITWILIHGLVLLIVGGFLFKAPLGLIATASQANIGGPISAPIVGATFSAELATVGLLMAILGNLLGTYLGLLTAFLAR
ncbi:MAG: DUF819 family protein [Candidatus Omnitrophica bacterium]|nr:DUF819 family protein [Candidatus Omnitrophota bacterium]